MTLRSDVGRRAVLVLAVLALAAASWWRLPDAAAGDRLDRGMKAAFAAFATARALNGLVSLVQSGELSAQVGLGMSVHPGALLDPVDDLVERFSDLMLSATVAFGVQKVLLSVGGHWTVAVLLTACALAWAALAAAGRRWPRWLVRALAVLVLARFAVPIATLGTDVLFRAFLEPTQQASRQALDALRGQAEAGAGAVTGAAAGTGAGTGAGAKAPPADAGTLAALRGWWARGADLPTQVERLTDAAGRIAEHVTDLVVVFLLQTLVFPLAMAWGLWQVLLSWLRAPPGSGPR